MNVILAFLRALLGIDPPSANLPPPAVLPGSQPGSAPGKAGSSRFQACLDEVLRHEGGFVNHPADPGGATNLGITQGTLSEWRGKSVSVDDVRNLTVAEAGEIYHARYWQPIRGDALPPGVDLAVFDGAVNSGPGRSARWLQQALGVAQDGIIGPETLAAVGRAKPATLIIEICDARMAFLRSLSTWPTFGKGWTARVNEVQAAALRVA